MRRSAPFVPAVSPWCRFVPSHGARIVEGTAAEAIAGLVAQAKPDRLVLGTRGLSGTRRLFLGSVTHELMDSLGIDILALPTGGPPA